MCNFFCGKLIFLWLEKIIFLIFLLCKKGGARFLEAVLSNSEKIFCVLLFLILLDIVFIYIYATQYVWFFIVLYVYAKSFCINIQKVLA